MVCKIFEYWYLVINCFQEKTKQIHYEFINSLKPVVLNGASSSGFNSPYQILVLFILNEKNKIIELNIIINNPNYN